VVLAILLLLLGAAVLYAGAEAAVRGATGMVRATGISAFTLGALLFGIDLEGTGAAVVASARGEPAIAVGEIFGTVVFLFSAAFGAALLFSHEPVPAPDPVMILTPALLLIGAALVISDRFVGRLEGGMLVAMYLAYVLLVVRWAPEARHRAHELEMRIPGRAFPLRSVGLTIGGVLLLAGGAAVLVAGAARLVAESDLAAGFVGAAILGVLVSLDEVLLEILPIRRGAPDLATGNLFGTLAAFCSGVLGAAGLVRPLDLDGAAATAFLGAAAVYAVVATVFLVRRQAWRGTGLVVVGFYVVWLLFSARI
jgi:cation:H+ antiporter